MGDITIEKYECQIKISYDTMMGYFVRFYKESVVMVINLAMV